MDQGGTLTSGLSLGKWDSTSSGTSGWAVLGAVPPTEQGTVAAHCVPWWLLRRLLKPGFLARPRGDRVDPGD